MRSFLFAGNFQTFRIECFFDDFVILGFYVYQVYGNIFLKGICTLYLAFIYYDRHTGDRGGRGIG